MLLYNLWWSSNDLNCMRFRISISLNSIIHSTHWGCLNYFLLLSDFCRVNFLRWSRVTGARINLLLFNFVFVKVGRGGEHTMSLVVIPLFIYRDCLRLAAVALSDSLELFLKFRVTWLATTHLIELKNIL